MGVAVRIEEIDDGVFPDREHQPIGALRPRKLVQVGTEPLRLSRQIDRLAEERALNQRVGMHLSDLVRLATGISGDTECVAESEALVDFRIDPEFRARPWPEP